MMESKNGANIHITEQFPVSKEALYKAWTEPGELMKWWKPMGKQLEDVENDIREGGKVAYRFSEGLTISGAYKQVQQNDTLVYSWIWQLPEDSIHKGDYLLTIKFSGEGSNSTLDVTQENFKDEHAVKPHREGWQESLKELRNYLQSNKAE